MADLTNPYPCSVEIKNDTKDAPQYALKKYCEPGQELAVAKELLEIEGEVRRDLGLPPRVPFKGNGEAA